MPSVEPEATSASAKGSAEVRMIAAETMNIATTVIRRARVGIETMRAAAPTNSSSLVSAPWPARHR